MSLDQEAIDNQLALLATHRRTLAHLLQQAAQYGGEVFAPPQTVNGIAVARANITLAKTALRENGGTVGDQPNDDAPSAISPDAIEAARNIAEQRALDTVLETYLDRMTELLIDRKLKSEPTAELRDMARIRTLTTMRRLDSQHNQSLVQFLQDAHLLGIPTPDKEPIIDLHGAKLEQADLRRVNLFQTNLPRAHLSRVDLEEAYLIGANLQDAELHSANLHNVKLDRAILRGAKLIGANLTGAKLTGAILIGADLTEADLTGADLKAGEDLQGTELPKANLDGAILKDATMPDGRKYEDWLKDNSE